MENEVIFVQFIVQELVDNPNDVSVIRQETNSGILLEVDVNQADLGRLIGQGGATAQALRHILRVFAIKNKDKYHLKINDNRKKQS